MELIYFIAGIILTVNFLGAYMLRKNNIAVGEALRKLQSYENISSLRASDLTQELKEVKEWIVGIQFDMEKESYDTISNINKRLELLEKIEDATNKEVANLKQSTTTAQSKLLTELQTLKNNLKALGQDPNFLNRY